MKAIFRFEGDLLTDSESEYMTTMVRSRVVEHYGARRLAEKLHPDKQIKRTGKDRETQRHTETEIQRSKKIEQETGSSMVF